MTFVPDEGSIPERERGQRLRALDQSFRPAAPIQNEELFAGRGKQLIAISDLCQDPGRHGVIFGERGVGKTSLANVSGEYQKALGSLWVRVGCNTSDTFETVWTRVFEDLALLPRSRPTEYGHLEAVAELAQDLYLAADTSSPDAVRRGLHALTGLIGAVICLDEFDRIQDDATSLLMSDCIKTLSDQMIGATVIVVGVADTVDSLISNHQSIQRAMTQVRMPRMQPDEIEEIIDNGYRAASLSVADPVKTWLVEVPQGLPYYAHLIAREAGRNAIREGRATIERLDWAMAVTEAAALTDQSIVRIYSEAIASSQRTIFEEVLLACAMADKDDLGFFTPPDVRDPLSDIMNERYELPRYSDHLAQLCTRGPILERRGAERRWRYRFIDPMMQPYIVIRGIQSGKLRLSNEPEPPS